MKKTEVNHVARILALLDAVKAAKYGHSNAVSIGIHETKEEPFALAVIDWCKRNGVRIDHYVTTNQGRTYEVWNIHLHPGEVSIWPVKIGLLDGRDDLQSKIEAIRKAADEEIQRLLDAQSSADAAVQ